MHEESETISVATDPGEVTERTSRIHPLVKLDFFVRLVACPAPAILVISARMTASETVPVGLWLPLVIYGVVWPHVAFLLARRSVDVRRSEMRSLLVDSAVSGVAIALLSFQTIPTLALVTGYASMLGSIGGVPLLLGGLAALLASMFLTAATVTDFAVTSHQSPIGTAVGAVVLFGFQTMMGLLTYRTARNFVNSRRRIAEQAEEIRTQNEALFQAREEALQAAQAKAAFLATMSHEIRTPLNGVLGMTRLLAETPLTAEQQDFVHTIQVSGTTLLTVINDILDYSRIESGRLELERVPVRVGEVIEEALEIVGERAREKGIELVCEVGEDVPESIIGDVTRLRQVLTNLVGNAVKFTERGEVVVSVRQSRAGSTETPAELEFEVRDSGIGIPEDRIAILFTPFSQADASTTRRYGGTGLGLAISRRLTEMMGGAITVRSIVGEGSTFTFTVQAPLAAQSPAAVSGDATLISGQRVLIVDDNATNRRVLSMQLERWGLVPEPAESASQALSALADERRFALAILDLHMPDVDGLMLARRIREEPRYRDLPLILLSSSLVQSKDDPEKLFQVRLMKPVRQSRLFDSVILALDRSAASRMPQRSEPGMQAIPASAPLNILVADDNETNRNLALLVIRRFGYEADLVVNGREAVESVERRAPSADAYDLVFMDVQMPEMDGLEATRRLRQLQLARPEESWPRIVAVTADAMPEDRGICLAAGMDDYLTKPLDFDDVRIVLTNAAERVAASEARPPKKSRPLPEATGVTSAPIMDWSRLDELREYDTPEGTMVRNAIAAFMGEGPAKLMSARSSAETRDVEILRSSAHALKGAAMNIGAVAVADCANRLEQAAKGNHFDGIDALIENLTIVLENTLADLESGSARTPDRGR